MCEAGLAELRRLLGERCGEGGDGRVERLVIDDLIDLLVEVWDDNRRRVMIRIGKVIPAAGFQRTTSSRRKRFRGYLEELLREIGWEEVFGSSANTYRKMPGDDSS